MKKTKCLYKETSQSEILPGVYKCSGKSNKCSSMIFIEGQALEELNSIMASQGLSFDPSKDLFLCPDCEE